VLCPHYTCVLVTCHEAVNAVPPYRYVPELSGYLYYLFRSMSVLYCLSLKHRTPASVLAYALSCMCLSLFTFYTPHLSAILNSLNYIMPWLPVMHFIVYPWRAFSRIRQCCASHCFGSECECFAYTLSGIWFVHWSIFLTALLLVRLLGLPELINYSSFGIIQSVVYY
jgi:hypothetical protein